MQDMQAQDRLHSWKRHGVGPALACTPQPPEQGLDLRGISFLSHFFTELVFHLITFSLSPLSSVPNFFLSSGAGGEEE